MTSPFCPILMIFLPMVTFALVLSPPAPQAVWCPRPSRPPSGRDPCLSLSSPSVRNCMPRSLSLCSGPTAAASFYAFLVYVMPTLAKMRESSSVVLSHPSELRLPLLWDRKAARQGAIPAPAPPPPPTNEGRTVPSFVARRAAFYISELRSIGKVVCVQAETSNTQPFQNSTLGIL